VATVVTLGAISTGDAVPASSPFKISAQATKDTVTIPFTVAGSGKLRAWSIRFGATHKKLNGRGVVCGNARCGNTVRSRLLGQALPANLTRADTYSELPSSADGAYTVYVSAYTDDGWG
jgi:hypothetical protein